MPVHQWIIFGTLLVTLGLFITGRWRYDIVALVALMIVVLTGLVPAGHAFSGFSNPAVITVAAVLVISRGLRNSGIVDLIGERLLRLKGGVIVQLAALTGIVAALSAFMNNIGALALLMPVAIQVARKKGVQASVFLMPLAFASLLGGMTTLIGTPPNIIVASFRSQTGAAPFGMFQFAPVGAGVALVGLLFIVLLGWRLIPRRQGSAEAHDLFEIEKYVTEVRLPEESKLVGKRLPEINTFIDGGVNILGLVRGNERRLAPSPGLVFREGDILILQIDAENLETLVAKARLELVGSERIVREDLESDEVGLMEAVIGINSPLVGRTAFGLDLRRRHGVNLLAVSRQGRRLRSRLDRIRLQGGDVVLLQSHVQTAREVLATLECLPLAQRELRIGQRRQLILPLTVFGLALLSTAFGLVPAPVAFVMACVIMVMAGCVSLREAYDSIDWSIIILLGAMIPVGEALETTGGAQLIAGSLLRLADRMPASWVLVLVLVLTMFLSDLVNNAAAVVLTAPIAIGVAQGLGTSADPFLMAIAVGASCAFLTPIGHQSNTLVMGPGGYKFGDYWRMGLLLELIIALVATPLILLFWPLYP
ncbi:SLC13 family permease [Candidatus Fermentibacteria bacterium]|nr:SLC13 family permease [Candidatus Fermentibacteria bacterium]